ncbi:hypothetical protein B5X24_HaOG203480 [Helicoverpa armigera]|uniref:Ig-like domain-containing protein n=1 Tax=Helicoverpa armigera TaxID=29058 RepID=A0A2W1BSL0_HELAM|nr:hypothetical protein B5X24_HaOG203480 [Helicoverpa armigera]
MYCGGACDAHTAQVRREVARSFLAQTPCGSGQSIPRSARGHSCPADMCARAWAPALCALAAAAAAAASLLPLDAERLHASVGGFAVMNCHLDFPFGNEIPYHLQWDKDVSK